MQRRIHRKTALIERFSGAPQTYTNHTNPGPKMSYYCCLTIDNIRKVTAKAGIGLSVKCPILAKYG